MKYFFEAIITFAQHVQAFMFMALRSLEWQGDIIGTPKVYLAILRLILRWYKVRYNPTKICYHWNAYLVLEIQYNV